MVAWIALNYSNFILVTNTQIFVISSELSQMDIESSGKGRESKHSYSSGRQSFLSLEALIEPRLSLRQKASLIEMMDLEVSRLSNRKSGNMMAEENELLQGYRQSRQSGSNYSFRPTIEEKDLNRKSNFNIKHQCLCQTEQDRCNGVHCICFLTPREICVIGQCCPRCIQSKNNFLRETRGWQLQSHKKEIQANSEQDLLMLMKQKNCKNMHYLKQIYANDPRMQNLTFCTCKKSHCQKKYCLCYERGLKCGQFCICIECTNKDNVEYEQDQAEQQKRWQRYATYCKEQQKPVQIQQDISQFMHEQLQEGEQLNQIMEFEPVNFDEMLQNIYQ